MSRCVGCDKALTTAEMMTKDENLVDMCWTCISAAFSSYNIVTDKEYHHSNVDGVDYITIYK